MNSATGESSNICHSDCALRMTLVAFDFGFFAPATITRDFQEKVDFAAEGVPSMIHFSLRL
jgi:hypothetical protein